MKPRFKSILSHIIWLHLIALAGVFGAISFSAYYLLGAAATNLEERVLLGHAAAVAEHLSYNESKWTLVLPPDLETLYTQSYRGYELAVRDGAGRVIFSSLPNKALIAEPDEDSAPSFFRLLDKDADFRGINYPVETKGSRALIQIAQDLTSEDVIHDDVIASFLFRIAWVGVLIFAILAAVDLFIFRRALAPITDASRMAQSVNPNSMGIRLPVAGLPEEVLPLVSATNQALDRLERAFKLQRDFIADAAHELRTPLSVLRTYTDMLADRTVATELRPHIEVMTRLVGQLLELAELESLTIGTEERADLASVCSEAVGLMAPIALAHNKTIGLKTHGDHCWVRGNAELLFRAVRNLIDNAIRHTAPGTGVEVELSGNGSVAIMDRGPGIPVAERRQIFRRFWRKDRRSENHSGLGLSIVDRVIEIHGGSIRIEDRPGGGAIFTVSLPG